MSIKLINMFLACWFLAPIIMGSVLAYFINRMEQNKHRASLGYMDSALEISRKN
jgi:hypothetical protein